MILSVSEVAQHLKATTDEVIAAVGFTLGELELAAEGCGLLPERYREAPVLPDHMLPTIAERVDAGRLAFLY